MIFLRFTKLKQVSYIFVSWSYDEMIKYDLLATVDFVVKKTGQKWIYYVGYSLGTTIDMVRNIKTDYGIIFILKI